MDRQSGRAGRPRSEQARAAVLHAVDDLLVEQGYAAMTMKGIAERAGVGRQTVYRWWSTKAEVLFEASVWDAAQELAITPTGDALDDLTAYLDAVIVFLTRSPAGAGYRALIGEAQHDGAVREMITGQDVLADSASLVLAAALPALDTAAVGPAAARLVGPVFFAILAGRDHRQLSAGDLAAAFLAGEQRTRLTTPHA